MEDKFIARLEKELSLKKQRFYEFHLPHRNTPESYEDVILEKVDPFVVFAEQEGLIDGFHFILHKDLDLRVSVKDGGNLEVLRKKAEELDFPDEKEKRWTMEDAPTELYGGVVGVHLCYEALEAFSRLIIKLLKAKKSVSKEPEFPDRDKVLGGLLNLTHQFVHYWYIQQGVENIQEAFFHLGLAEYWFKKLCDKYNIREVDHAFRHLSKAGQILESKFAQR
jgi:hypothetical protein